MALTAHEKLAIFNIVYFSLALPVSLWVCKKQGFGRSLGWLYLITLPVFRIAGAACLIAADEDSKPSVGLLDAAGILNGLGLISLELTLLGLVERVNAGMNNVFRYASKGLPLCHIMLIVAGSLAITGGVEASQGNLNHPHTLHTGQSLRKVSAVLLLFVYLILVAVTGGILPRMNQAWIGDRHITYAAAVSFPFLLVRVIYSLISAFDYNSATFNPTSPNVYVQAFMQVLMEVIIIGLFLAVGLMVDSVKRVREQQVKEADPPGMSPSASEQAPRIVPGNDVELGTLPARTQET